MLWLSLREGATLTSDETQWKASATGFRLPFSWIPELEWKKLSHRSAPPLDRMQVLVKSTQKTSGDESQLSQLFETV